MSDYSEEDYGSPLSDTVINIPDEDNSTNAVIDDELQDLGVNLVDQNVLENQIMAQVIIIILYRIKAKFLENLYQPFNYLLY